VQFLAGDYIERFCFTEGDQIHFNQSKELQHYIDGREIINEFLHICNNVDLCNGSGRLAEIFTITILLPACLVLLSFFSRQ
jgi:hypothetical protein